jgi:hypothetical protein
LFENSNQEDFETEDCYLKIKIFKFFCVRKKRLFWKATDIFDALLFAIPTNKVASWPFWKQFFRNKMIRPCSPLFSPILAQFQQNIQHFLKFQNFI